jgi:hypothetical protein
MYVEVRKNPKYSGKTSTYRAENIFPKYLLYYVYEIARKYLRKKKRYSNFSDSVLESNIHLKDESYPTPTFSLRQVLSFTQSF